MKTTLASLEELAEVFEKDYREADDAYGKWYDTGEGDEEILQENAWVAETRVERIERVIEDIREALSL